MKFTLKAYSIWEYGRRKDAQGMPHQEDSLYPRFGQAHDGDRLFIVCDGMGGHDAGEVASATVCEAMSQAIIADGRDPEGVFTPDDLSRALQQAFDALDRKDNGAVKKMGTTMTLLKLHAGGATIAHIGDSRVYHIRPGKTADDTAILFETEDHSLVNDLIKIGELTREEARFSRQRNIITRAMQPNMERRPKADVYQTADIQSGDFFYLCSDGMLEQPDMESGEALKAIFSEQGGTDADRLQTLLQATANNRDNHTAFIVHILSVDQTAEVVPVVEDTPPLMIPAEVITSENFTSAKGMRAENTEDTPIVETPPAPATQDAMPCNQVLTSAGEGKPQNRTSWFRWAVLFIAALIVAALVLALLWWM